MFFELRNDSIDELRLLEDAGEDLREVASIQDGRKVAFDGCVDVGLDIRLPKQTCYGFSNRAEDVFGFDFVGTHGGGKEFFTNHSVDCHYAVVDVGLHQAGGLHLG